MAVPWGPILYYFVTYIPKQKGDDKSRTHTTKTQDDQAAT